MQKKFLIPSVTIVLTFVAFYFHLQYHLRQVLPNACCGYEADPEFITFWFIIFYGTLYLIILAIVLWIETSFLFLKKKQK